MSLPPGAYRLDSALLNAVMAASPEWPHGAIRLRAFTRIGVDFGLSGGEVYRVEADTTHGESISFVLKREAALAVERAMRFHRAIGSKVAGSVPGYLGGSVDQENDTGVLLLEKIAPAEQGDVLAGCTNLQALAAVRSLARVHAAAWDTVTGVAEPAPRWEAQALAPDQWAARLTAATRRFPEVTGPVIDRLQELPRKVEAAIPSLRAGDLGWIHCDAHLDNVLFRPEGDAVLLDWSGAAIGPPAVDLARLLTEGVNAGGREDLAAELVSAYASELARCGATVVIEDLWDALSKSLALLVQAAVGWAAREEDRPPVARIRALQEQLLRSVLAWASNEQMTKPGHVFAL